MKKNGAFIKYWYLWVVVILLPIALYWIIQLPCGFDAIGGEDAPRVWLGFWGGYTGAIISASVAFYILDKQIKASKEENDKSRDANIKQNEANRAAQRKTIEYQQRQQWLNDFKKVAAEYISVFNSNDLVIAMNNLTINPGQTYNITKNIFDRLQIVDAKMCLAKANDEAANNLYDNTKALFDTFRSVANDIHRLSVLVTNNRNPDDYRCTIAKQTGNAAYIKNAQNGFSEELKNMVHPDFLGLGVDEIILLAKERCKSIENTIKEVSDLILKYTAEEQQRINAILQ